MSKFLYFDFSRVCEYSEYSPEQYGDWEEDWAVMFLGRASFSSDDFYSPESESVDDSWKTGDSGWFVWVNYSTGDSFGRSLRGSICIVDIFKDFAEAVKCRNDIQNNKATYIKEGKECKIYAPWEGYFENLESVSCDSFDIT